MRLWRPRNHVIVMQASGYLHHEFARQIIRALNGTQGTICQFHDWSEMVGFDTRCQRDLTAWHVRHRDRLACLHILTKSAIVRMGVSVANVPLRGFIHLCESRLSMLEELERVLI